MACTLGISNSVNSVHSNPSCEYRVLSGAGSHDSSSDFFLSRRAVCKNPSPQGKRPPPPKPGKVAVLTVSRLPSVPVDGSGFSGWSVVVGAGSGSSGWVVVVGRSGWSVVVGAGSGLSMVVGGSGLAVVVGAVVVVVETVVVVDGGASMAAGSSSSGELEQPRVTSVSRISPAVPVRLVPLACRGVTPANRRPVRTAYQMIPITRMGTGGIPSVNIDARRDRDVTRPTGLEPTAGGRAVRLTPASPFTGRPMMGGWFLVDTIRCHDRGLCRIAC